MSPRSTQTAIAVTEEEEIERREYENSGAKNSWSITMSPVGCDA